MDDISRQQLRELIRAHQIRLHLATRELRDEGQWQAVLDALDELAQLQPGYPDPDQLGLWAQGLKRREELYSHAVVARDRGNLPIAVAELMTLLREFPDDFRAEGLLHKIGSMKRQSEGEVRPDEDVFKFGTYPPSEGSHKVGVFIDFENLYYHLKRMRYTLNSMALIEAIRKSISESGDITIMRAYADWGLIHQVEVSRNARSSAWRASVFQVYKVGRDTPMV